MGPAHAPGRLTRLQSVVPRPTIYLDNASTSWPKPPCVPEAVAACLREGGATPGRGGYSMAAESGRMVERLRRRLAALVGAPDPDRIVLTGSATEALNIAILGLFPGTPTAPRPRVVTTDLEHNSVVRPLQHLAARQLIDLAVVPADSRGCITPEKVLAAADERTALVAMTAASNVTGTILPVGEVGRALRKRHPAALFLVDASQSIGLVPLHVERDAIDLLAFAGHKALLGPSGTGALFVSSRAWPGDGSTRVIVPTRLGGTGVDSASPGMPERMPLLLEPGTPNTPGFAGLLAALEDPARADAESMLAHERRLMVRLAKALADEPRIRLLGPEDREEAVGVLALVVVGQSPDDIAGALDASFGIAVRAGLHCAPGTHRALGTIDGGGAVRVSPGPFSTSEDVDKLADALRAIARAG